MRLKAEFFENEADARAIIKTLQEEAAKLVEVAASGDLGAVGQQLGKVGAQCGACHTAYRK